MEYPPRVHFFDWADRLESLLYRAETRKLTAQDLRLAEEWTLSVIRTSHPTWTEEQVQRYADNLLNLHASFSDAWSQRNSF